MKKLLLSTAASAAIVLVPASQAFAWTYGLKGSGACQSNGSFKITWVVDNTTENESLNITSSSATSVVPVGTKVAAHKTASYAQSVNGAKVDSFTLTLKGNFPSDKTIRTRSATVSLQQACAQPAPNPTPSPTPQPGRGSGPVVTPVATPVTQVVAPVGAVNAGEGSNSGSVAALSGLTGSVFAAGFGVFKLRKNR